MAVEEKPYLSDAINYKEEIEPYRYITLYSGVGSGKNTFINKIISGDAERGIPKKTVLLITSRRAKVDELLTDDEIDATGKIGRWGNIHREMNGSDDPEYYSEYARIIKCDSGEHRVYQQSVICTNAFIEKFFQYCYVPSNVVTHLWELFDLIVVDEVHSLVLDATYQSAPFYVKMLINEVLRRHSLADENEAKPEEERDPHVRRPLCERVILMTGTSGPIEILPNPEKNATVLDKMETCKNVVPKNVWFIKMENTRERIAEQIAAGERVVYFSNNVLLPSDFDKKNRIPTERITASFSKEEKRSAIKKDEKHKSVYENMIETEKSIAESGHIPSNFSLLLTTSRNKEGINIVDKDVQHIYVETHNLADIQQMAGRVRCGVENLYIIIDAPDHHLDDWELV